jgi:hypothetical protein
MRKDEALMFDTDSLLTLGIMANTYKNILSTQEEFKVIEKIKETIRTEIVLRIKDLSLHQHICILSPFVLY